MFRWDILTNWRVQGSFFSDCYWDRNFIFGSIWVSHYYCSWFCTWCACIDWCLPVIGSSWRKCPLVSNTIFSIWCSAMIYRNWLSLWIIVICLWLNLNSHRYFVNCTIIISNNHCCRFITWSCRIWCSTLPCVSRISWKVTLIGDTRSGTWSISMFCWDIFTNWCVVVSTRCHIHIHIHIFRRTIWVANCDRCWFCSRCTCVRCSPFPSIGCASWKICFVSNSVFCTWCIIVFNSEVLSIWSKAFSFCIVVVNISDYNISSCRVSCSWC